MRVLKHKLIEFSEVLLSELGQEMRFDSEYWEPSYLRNEDLLKSKKHTQIKQLAHNIQYGISVAMNETGVGYPILKMDNIMDMLAEDKDSKFADISAKTFQHFELKKYDVLFNRVNSDEFVGRTGIYLLDGEHTFASYLVKVDTQKPHTNCYLTTFLNCKYGKISLQRVKRRAVNQANINARELSNLFIPLPTESFQKAIQELVVEAQKQKLLSEKLYKEAEEILLNELGLLNWKPNTVSFKLNGVDFKIENTINSMNYSEIMKDDRIDSEFWEAHYFEIVKKLKAYKKYDLLKNVCFVFETHTTPEKNKIHKYIELANIGDNGIINGCIEDYGKNLPTRARRLVKANQVVISSIEGSLSSCGLIPQELDNAFCSTGFYLISSKIINSETLLVLFKSTPFQTLMKKACSGTILTAIGRRFFNNLIVPVIDKPIQRKIREKIVDSTSSKVKNKNLLETAKRALEIFIEEDEKAALKLINLKS